jgi:hypothetical protein
MSTSGDTTMWRESLTLFLFGLIISYTATLSGCVGWRDWTGPGLCWTYDGQQHCVKVHRVQDRNNNTPTPHWPTGKP